MLLRMYEELSVTTWNYTYPNLDITCNKLSYEVDMTGPLHERATLWFNSCKRPPPDKQPLSLCILGGRLREV